MLVTLSLVLWVGFALVCVFNPKFYRAVFDSDSARTPEEAAAPSGWGARVFMGLLGPPLFGAMLWIIGFIAKWVGWFLFLPIAHYFDIVEMMK